MLFRFDDCVLDVERRELRRGAIVRSLEPQVFDLLHLLITHRDRAVRRDEIFKIIWRGRFVSESVLGSRINAARRAIGDDGTQQRLIRTLRRNGFRFTGRIDGRELAPGQYRLQALPALAGYAGQAGGVTFRIVR